MDISQKNILIFDFDGVIADSLDIFMKKAITACIKYGSTQVKTKEDFLSLFEDNLYESLVKRGIPEDKLQNMIEELRIGPKEQNKIKIFDGIKEALLQLSKNHRIFIITSNVTQAVEEFLKSKGITFFEEVMGADKGTSKVKKIELIKLKFPKYELVYIGDTLGDIIEGKKAGAKTVAVTWGWHDENRLKKGKPDYMVRNPKELIKLFQTR